MFKLAITVLYATPLISVAVMLSVFGVDEGSTRAATAALVGTYAPLGGGHLTAFIR